MHRVQAFRKEPNLISSSAAGPFIAAQPQIRAGPILNMPKINDNFMNIQHSNPAREKHVVPQAHETVVDRKFSSIFANFAVAKMSFLSITGFSRLTGRQNFQDSLNMTRGGAFWYRVTELD